MEDQKDWLIIALCPHARKGGRSKRKKQTSKTSHCASADTARPSVDGQSKPDEREKKEENLARTPETAFTRVCRYRRSKGEGVHKVGRGIRSDLEKKGEGEKKDLKDQSATVEKTSFFWKGR